MLVKVTRVYTDTAGNTRFEEEPVNMEEKSKWGYHSVPRGNVDSFFFQNILPHHDWDFLTVTNKIYITILEGEMELEVSNGEKKIFRPGDVILLDDDSGLGHKPKTFETTVCALVILMKEDV